MLAYDVAGSSWQLAGKQLIAHYLSALSGTGTVDRWLGQCRRVDRFRALPATEIENAVKLFVQDSGGRRRHSLEADGNCDRWRRCSLRPMTPFGLKARKQCLGSRWGAGAHGIQELRSCPDPRDDLKVDPLIWDPNGIYCLDTPGGSGWWCVGLRHSAGWMLKTAVVTNLRVLLIILLDPYKPKPKP